jgi:hypothetical protein
MVWDSRGEQSNIKPKQTEWSDGTNNSQGVARSDAYVGSTKS